MREKVPADTFIGIGIGIGEFGASRNTGRGVYKGQGCEIIGPGNVTVADLPGTIQDA